MTARATWVAGAALIAAAAAAPLPLHAQSAGGGLAAGGRGLFGATRTNPDSRQSLDFTVLLAEAYDDDALADVRPNITPGVRQAPGFHTTLTGAGAFRRELGRDSQLAASGTAALRYYNELSEVRTVSHSAALGLTTRMPARLTLRGNQTASYSPSYLYGLFGGGLSPEVGEAPSAAPDYAINNSESYSYNSSVTLGRDVGRTGRLSASGTFQYTDYRDETFRNDVENSGIRGEFRQGLTRNVGISASYGYRTGNFGYVVDSTTSEHTADIGFDYRHPFSATRSAQLAFRVGGSATEIPESASSIVSGAKYRFQGEATGTLQFARGWAARGSFRRGLEYMPALTEPVFIDGFNTSLDGLLTRRLQLSLGAGYASGESILRLAGSGGFDTYTGNARLQVAATRTLAFFGEYLYYVYDFGGHTQLLPEAPARLERNGIRAGLTLLVPALGR